ncbi:MAG TPA: FbpB family small basic protein [Bacillota bacterium]|nr:FbpB family small basic protein [Bacillota bacterium]
MSFEELVSENRKQIRNDRKLMELIEDRLEMNRHTLSKKGEKSG